MASTLRRLYLGELCPEAEHTPERERFSQEYAQIEARCGALLACLDAQTAQALADCEEARQELAAQEIADAYLRGMRMGAELVLELLGRDAVGSACEDKDKG